MRPARPSRACECLTSSRTRRSAPPRAQLLVHRAPCVPLSSSRCFLLSTDAGNLAGLRTRVRSIALAALASSTLLPFQRWIVAALLSDAFSTTDLEAYCADESLAHLSFDERKWRRRMELCLVAKEVELEVSAAIQEVYSVRLFSFSCCRC